MTKYKPSFTLVKVVNPDKKASFVVGLALLADGTIRTLTLGRWTGRFALEASRWALARDMDRARKRFYEEKQHETSQDQ